MAPKDNDDVIQISTLTNKLYQIGTESHFKTRANLLREYVGCTDTVGGHIRIQCDDHVFLDVRVTKGEYESLSKTQYSKHRIITRNTKYHYVKVYERNSQGKTQKKPLVCLRCDLNGEKMELVWLSNGKNFSGKHSMKLFNLFYKALRPNQCFLHDDSTVSVKLSKEVIREDVRKERKRASRRRQKSPYKKRASKKKKKAKKKTRKNKPNRNLKLYLRTVRSLATGKTWYESMGFKPAKLDDIRYYYLPNKVCSQHPSRFRASVDTLRKMSVKDMYATFPASSHKNLDDIRKEIGVPTANSHVSLGTVTKRVLSQIRKKPKSLMAQRTLKKFKSTVLTDHTLKMNQDNVTPKLKNYTKHLRNIWTTCIFKKDKPIVCG